MISFSSLPISSDSFAYGVGSGDFGNENVELVQSVAILEFAKPVTFEKCDLWKTQPLSEKQLLLVVMQSRLL